MFKKYGLQIAIAAIFIIILINFDATTEDTEFGIRLACLIVPLWFAGSIGMTAINAIYKIATEIIKRLIKKSTLYIPCPKVYIPKFLRHITKKSLPEKVYLPTSIYNAAVAVITAIIQIIGHCSFAVLMASTNLYASYFTKLKTGNYWLLETNIHDLLSVYFCLAILAFEIIVVVNSTYQSVFVYREEESRDVQHSH